MPKKYTFELFRGETLALELSDIRDETGVAVTDATGWTGSIQLRTDLGANPAATIAGVPAAGKMRFQTSTSGLALGAYEFAVYLRSPSGFVSYPVIGEVVLTEAPTRP